MIFSRKRNFSAELQVKPIQLTIDEHVGDGVSGEKFRPQARRGSGEKGQRDKPLCAAFQRRNLSNIN